jgi:hypothetical protein
MRRPDWCHTAYHGSLPSELFIFAVSHIGGSLAFRASRSAYSFCHLPFSLQWTCRSYGHVTMWTEAFGLYRALPAARVMSSFMPPTVVQRPTMVWKLGMSDTLDWGWYSFVRCMLHIMRIQMAGQSSRSDHASYAFGTFTRLSLSVTLRFDRGSTSSSARDRLTRVAAVKVAGVW